MTADRLDISDSFTWEEDLPRPQWDLLATWVQERVEPADRPAAWTDIARQWLEKLRPALGRSYRTDESDHFLVLAPRPEPRADLLLAFAEKCRQALLAALPGVTAFRSPGKQVVLAIADPESYYTYLSVYYPEGHHGGSAGVHVREGYPHVALCGTELAALENTLAHELTHASLHQLSLPQWAEEGLAQMFEHDMTGRAQLLVNEEMARTHKRYWKKHGLDLLWRGEGFSRPDKAQRLSYELAEILMRLLCSDHRPRWFGLDKGPQRRLFAFLREADASDGGEAAARENLGFGVGELAARFLGPGDWSPSL
jgi:hypothetical protein